MIKNIKQAKKAGEQQEAGKREGNNKKGSHLAGLKLPSKFVSPKGILSSLINERWPLLLFFTTSSEADGRRGSP
jgi:hypothetical protein